MKIFTLFLLLLGALAISGQTIESSVGSPTPLNGEEVSARADAISIQTQNEPNPDGVLFIVARLGIGETTRELNRRRLFNMRQRLAIRIPDQKMITVEGERVDTYGRIEIYWKGILTDVLPIRKNKDIDVDCCGDDERYYPYKDVAERRQKQKRKDAGKIHIRKTFSQIAI